MKKPIVYCLLILLSFGRILCTNDIYRDIAESWGAPVAIALAVGGAAIKLSAEFKKQYDDAEAKKTELSENALSTLRSIHVYNPLLTPEQNYKLNYNNINYLGNRRKFKRLFEDSDLLQSQFLKVNNICVQR